MSFEVLSVFEQLEDGVTEEFIEGKFVPKLNYDGERIIKQLKLMFDLYEKGQIRK